MFDRIQKGRPANKESAQEKEDSERLVVVLGGRAAANILPSKRDHRDNMSVKWSSLSLHCFFMSLFFLLLYYQYCTCSQ